MTYIATLCSHNQCGDTIFLALFKATSLSIKAFIASKVTNSLETIGVVMSYALVILTDTHLSIHMRKHPSESYAFSVVTNINNSS